MPGEGGIVRKGGRRGLKVGGGDKNPKTRDRRASRGLKASRGGTLRKG